MSTQVLRLITRLNIGGPARQALLLTKALRDTHPTILAAGTPQQGEGELSESGVEVVRVPLVRPLVPRTDLAGFRAIRGLIRHHHPALIHTHMAKAGTLGRLAAATVHPRPRTVHTFHGHVLEGYFPPALGRAFIAIERTLARRTDVLVAISPEIRDALLDLGVGRPEQYRLVPLGFDLSDHLAVNGHSGKLRAALGLDDRTPLIGALGRLAPVKDYDLLLRVAQQVQDAHFVILGDGELRATLEHAAVHYGIADRLHFPGWWTDVPSALADLDLVLLTSRNEGTPVALIEAGAAGRPVVATDVGGVRYVVEHGRTGLLAAPGDLDGLVTAVRSLLDSAQHRRDLGLAARARIPARFGRARLVDEISALYDELIR